MSGAVRQRFADSRWHFQHGPIDCIVAAEGEAGAAAECIDHAWSRFRGVLDELVAELPMLRADLSLPTAASIAPRGSVARRMVAACRPHAKEGRFITAMAAVAGSVAEALIASFDDPRIHCAYVNNGGDIALVLNGGAHYDVGVVSDLIAPSLGHPERSEGPRLPPTLAGRFRLTAESAVRGIATSGWRGRSFSLGIADSATVLAATASAADAAATLVANAVDIDDARIARAPASSLRDNSDLGDRLVVRHVPALPDRLVHDALDRGATEARAQIRAGRIIAAVLSLQGRWRVVGDVEATLTPALSRPAGEGDRLPPSPRAWGEGRGEGRAPMLTFTATEPEKTC